ncbi:cysteine/glutathione ABC transporter ATP-binding protein/permease CydC [Marinobacterium sp. AK62]|uniref:Cysteine/glutathione ABC transporter ATP-binding protein/permease CydC n=1 Tax=Marinobacterium alkalitolerans TaxID=1542925 RepID=A0ABS3ZAA8_9GAMM|nr:cysteine/glutathione ABC transporter ATP-binding protein/permease CydC [Marinobacterium alkalitolerans]MBP0048642.1 cysteine/glutathione ABC transporter ATP-binding protein/permease CydC [Marinobacterium alkalitolerans]
MQVLVPFIRLMRAHLGWVLLGMVAGLLTLLASIGLLTLSGWFISATALAGVTLAGAQAFNYFTPGAGVRGFAILRTAGRYAERITTHEATFRLLAQLRVWFYRRLEPLGPARLQRYRSADLLNRLVADVDALDNLYLRVLAPTLIAALVGVAGTAFIAFFSLPMAVIVLLALVLAGVGLPWLSHRAGRRLGERQIELTRQLRIELTGLVQGLADLAIYGGVERVVAQAAQVERRLYSVQRRMALISGATAGLMTLISGVCAVLVLMLGVLLVQAAQLAPAQLAMLVLCVLALFEAVAPLPLAYQYLGKTLKAAERLTEIANAEPDIVYPDTPLTAPEPGRLTFEAVSFRYTDEGPWALTAFDVDVAPGESILVLGHTGSGKSTLLNLLARFHTPTQGRVLLGGLPVDQYPESQLRAHLATLSQPVELFAGSLADNLRIAAPEASDAAMLDVLKQVELEQDLGEAPLAYAVGESGSRLSGGQRKRVALARALLCEAPVLWLDEPTEGLDAETERRVMGRVLEHCSGSGQTLVMISHHLQMADQFDRVLVLDAGRLVEQGAPKELAARSGSRFAELNQL